jgi:hypothetical protein
MSSFVSAGLLLSLVVLLTWTLALTNLMGSLFPG